MSHFTHVRTRIVDRDSLLEALADLGFGSEKVGVHEVPVPLYGYQGDRRSQVANVVIPKAHVGAASNDIGFEKLSDGTYRAWVSEYDRRSYGDQWMKRLTQRYAYHATKKTMKQQGFAIAEEAVEKTGEIRLVLRRFG